MQHSLTLAGGPRAARTGFFSYAALANLIGMLLVSTLAHGAQVTFRWDYAASGASGFTLYCGLPGGQYTAIVDAGNTDTYTLAGLTAGRTYECAVTAYDAARSQSGFSAPLRIYVAAAGRCARACDGDLNGDGKVNALDVGVMRQSWGTSAADADFNGDGIVNALDLGIFKSVFQ